jgi:hypothetical protein
LRSAFLFLAQHPWEQDGTIKGCIQYTDGTALFVMDFPGNKPATPHEFKMNGMVC